MVVPRIPPEDPNTWTDDEWFEWLAEVDEEAPADATGPSRKPRGAVGTVLGAAMVGLANVIYGEKQTDIVMVVEADGDPPGDELLDVYLDPEDPDGSTVTVRPWLEGETE